MTVWVDTLNGGGMRAWLLALVPPAATRIASGQSLDPFGTSMRTLSTQARAWLPRVRDGAPVGDGDRRRNQAPVDLRSAGLVEAGSPKLTPLGSSVLALWEKRAIPSGFDYELELAVVLLQEAVRLQVRQYLDRLAFWWDIRGLYDVDELLHMDELLMLLPYLNQTLADFNPWGVLAGARRPLSSPLDWSGLAASVVGRDSDTDHAVDLLRRRTIDRRPVDARRVFCHAMELIFGHNDRPDTIKATLATLKLPERAAR
jgi:hypothetical protein